MIEHDAQQDRNGVCAFVELGPRHTGGHDAAKLLEIQLAFKWLLKQCKDDRVYQRLFTQQGCKTAICAGVEALQLRYDSCIKEFEARTRAAAHKYPSCTLPTASVDCEPEPASVDCDLVEMQRRDPTYHSYKAALRVNGYRKLLKWDKKDDEVEGMC